MSPEFEELGVPGATFVPDAVSVVPGKTMGDDEPWPVICLHMTGHWRVGTGQGAADTIDVMIGARPEHMPCILADLTSGIAHQGAAALYDVLTKGGQP